jgi:predicted Zn-dependent protease
MAGLFYNLGRKAGPKVRKGIWYWRTLTGNEAQRLQAEYDVGADLAVEIRQELDVITQGRAVDIVNDISKKILPCVGNKFRKFNFTVVAGKEANAFALPGGFIFLTAPLFEVCDYNADEIAFVIGHEMAHVMRHHAIDRIASSSAIDIISKTMPGRGALGAWLKNVGLKFVVASYSQDREHQADSLGTRLFSTAGYDANAAITMLQRLGELGKNNDASVLGAYFSTHPPFHERIACVKKMIKKQN